MCKARLGVATDMSSGYCLDLKRYKEVSEEDTRRVSERNTERILDVNCGQRVQLGPQFREIVKIEFGLIKNPSI